MSRYGIVVIGRNEGERLVRCLRSVLVLRVPIIYVDSNSEDQSVERAADMGVTSHRLSANPNAAKARNAGFEKLMSDGSPLEFIQFVDGDCELSEDWPVQALQCFDEEPNVAIICGRLRERDPTSSVFNRLADIEWDRPAGVIRSCGGIFMVRSSVFRSIGGFNSNTPAGEEPELCMRIRDAGHKIQRLEAMMASHDSAMHSFRQWWWREVRTGYGGLDVAMRLGCTDFSRSLRSARVWALGWPVVLTATTITAWYFVGWRWGIGLGVFVLAAWPAQALRLAIRARARGYSFGTATAHGLLTMIGKWSQLLGQWRCVKDRRAGRLPVVISEKVAP
ncbi:MAG: glycosyltransferase [Planctomycetota bacterium]